MERKENDLMMNMVANPDFTIEDFALIGFNTDNTSLLDQNVYKRDSSIQKAFSNDEGKFNEKAFNDAYSKAVMNYNEMSLENLYNKLKEEVMFHSNNIFAPVEKRKQGPDFKQIVVSNPDRITSSMHRLGEVGERTKSRDELAQTNKVLLNPKEVEKGGEAKWGENPNNGFFDYFFDTLVMAQWDEDGVHVDPVTGQEVQHLKGELKINDEGTYYYEKLDGRDIYGRLVLNKMNVLTEDGSKWNKYDFFDSDDIEQKSIGGTVMKNLALVGSMFIPYVGPWVTALSIAPLLVSLTGTLGKMFTGSDSPVFSEMEGWGKSLNRQMAKTEYALNNTWCWENFITLIGDVAGLLKEQRFFFEQFPAIFKGSFITESAQAKKLALFQKAENLVTESKIAEMGAKGATDAEKLLARVELNKNAAFEASQKLNSWIKGYQKIGEIYSKGYMTAITVGDTYGEAKEAGASDLEATVLTLGYAAAEAWILNTGIGEWILPELRADKYKNKAIIKAVTKLPEELKDIPKGDTKSYVRKLFNIGKNIAKAEYANGTRTAKATLAAGLGEGIEEVSEEFLADFSKGCFNVVQLLQGDKTRMNSFGFSWDKDGNRKWDASELVDRYGMSLVGGFVGGSLTNLGTNYKMGKSYDNMTSEQAIQEIVYMSRNNELDGLLKTLDKMTVSDKNTSFFDTHTVGGKAISKPGSASNSKDAFVKEAFRKQVQMIDELLHAEGVKLSDTSFLNKQTLDDMRFVALQQASTAGLFMNEFNNLSVDLIKKTNEIKAIEDKAYDTNEDGTITDKERRNKKELSPEDKKLLQQKNTELNEIRTKIKDLVEGKRADEFIGVTLFEMSPGLSNLPITLPLFAEKLYNKKYVDLKPEEKESARQKYEEWKNAEGKDQIKQAYNVYRYISEQASNTIKSSENNYRNQTEEVKKLDEVVSNFYSALNNFNLDEIDPEVWLDSALAADYVLRRFQQFENVISPDEIRTIIDDGNTKIRALDSITDEAVKKLELTKIKTEQSQKISELFNAKLDSYIQPFIDQKFANTETKNLLIRLVKTIQLNYRNEYSSLRNKIDNIEMSMMLGEDVFSSDILTEDEKIEYNGLLEDEIIQELENKSQQLILKSSDLESKIDVIENLSNTPFEKNLNEFAISISGTPVNITQLLEKVNDTFNKNEKTLDNFDIEELTLNELRNAIATIEMYKMAINGAKNDNGGLSNIYGYNVTLNEVSKKLGKTLDLAEIDTDFANIVTSDIDVNLNKLKFVLQLYTAVNGSKAGKQNKIGIVKDTLFYKGIRKIIEIPDDDPIIPLIDPTSWAKFKNELGSLDLLENIANGSKSTSLSEDEKTRFEQQKIQMEDAIFEFFENNDNPEVIKRIIKLFDLYDKSTNILTETLDTMDGPSMVWYLASRAAVKSSEFNALYKTILDPNSKLLPVPTLEMAVYNAYANVINGDVITKWHDLYRQAVKEDWATKTVDERNEIFEKKFGEETGPLSNDKYVDYCFNFLQVPKFSNMCLVEGAPGTGKTTAVFNLAKELLAKTDPDILKNVAIVHGANKKSAEKLKENLGVEGTAFSLEEFLLKVIVDYAHSDSDIDGFVNIDKSNFKFNSDKELTTTKAITKVDAPSIIFIDEITKFNLYEIDAINKYALYHGITVITAGDFDQSGVIAKHEVTYDDYNGTFSASADRNLFSRSPKLGFSMRTDNIILTDNIIKFRAWMNSDRTQLIDLNYYEDDSGIYGTKIKDITDLDEIKADIKKLVDTLSTDDSGNKQLIGFIYSDKNSEIYKYIEANYKDNFKFLEGGSAQGLEALYYVIDFSTRDYPDDAEGQSNFNKALYTGISRSLQAGLVIKNGSGKNPIGKSNKVDHLIKEPLGEAIIKKYTNEKINILNAITGDTYPTYKPRKKGADDTIDESGTDDADEPLDDGTPPTPPPASPDSTPPPASPDPTPPPASPDPTPPPASVTLSTSEMIARYGTIALLRNFDFEHDGKKTRLEFLPLTVSNNKGNRIEHSTSPIVIVKGKPVCSIKVGSDYYPFYMDGDKWHFFGGFDEYVKPITYKIHFDNPNKNFITDLENKLLQVTGVISDAPKCDNPDTFNNIRNLITLDDEIAYSVIDALADIHKKFNDVSTPLTPTPTNTEYTHAELVDKFGDHLNINAFEIEVDGKKAMLELEEIPFSELNIVNGKVERKKGKCNILSYKDRLIVLVKIGDWYQPFYRSTGLGGKTYIDPKDGIRKPLPNNVWYPFVGIADEFINKTNGDDLYEYYNNDVFKAVCEWLNNNIPKGDNIAPIVRADEEISSSILNRSFDLGVTENKKKYSVVIVENNAKIANRRITEEWNRVTHSFSAEQELFEILKNEASLLFNEADIKSRTLQTVLNLESLSRGHDNYMTDLPDITKNVDSYETLPEYTLLELLANLLNILLNKNGILPLPTLPLYKPTLPPKSKPEAKGLFKVCSDPGKTIKEDGVTTVFINDATTPEAKLYATNLKNALSTRFPHIKFLLYSETKDYYKSMEGHKPDHEPVLPDDFIVKEGDDLELLDSNGQPVKLTVEDIKWTNDKWEITVKSADGTKLNYTEDELKQLLDQGNLKSWKPVEEVETSTLDGGKGSKSVRVESAYKKSIDESNAGSRNPLMKAEMVDGVWELNMFLYSCNTFETGLVFDENGKLVDDPELKQWSEKRIDSYHGLSKISKKGGVNVTLDNYLNILGDLRSALLNATDKRELCSELESILKLKGLSVRFSFKITPKETKGEKDFVETTPNTYGKSKRERLVGNGNYNSGATDISYNNIVAIVTNKKGVDILEVPLLSISNPITLAKMKNGDEYIFKDLALMIEQESKKGTRFFDIIKKMREITENKPEYARFDDLCKLYAMTYRSLFKLPEDWLPSTSLTNLGALFTTGKGINHILPEGRYEAKPENWIDISTFAKNPELRVTPVLKSKDGTIDVDGQRVKILKAGHPFVLVSHDTTINTTEDIINQFIKLQQSGYKGIKKVERVYVVAPTVSLEEYAEYIKNIAYISKKNLSGVKPLSNFHTPYHLLKQIILNPEIWDIAKNKLILQNADLLAHEILNVINKENESGGSTIGVDNALKTPVEVLKDRSMQRATFFARMLYHILYNPKSALNPTSEPTIDSNMIDKLKTLMSDKDMQIYRDIRLTGNEVGPFTVADVDANWEVDGVPMKINGKLDSYMFQGNMGNLVREWVNSIKPKSFTNPKTGELVTALKTDSDRYNFQRRKVQASVEYSNMEVILNNLNQQGLDSSLLDQIKYSILHSQNIDKDTYSELNFNLDLDNITAILLDNGVFAMRFENDLIVINDELFKDAENIEVLLNDIDPIIDLQSAKDSGFKIRMIKNGSEIEYEATFDGSEISIDVPKPVTEQLGVELNELDAQSYIDLLEALRAVYTEATGRNKWRPLDNILAKALNMSDSDIINSIQNLCYNEHLVNNKDRIIQLVQELAGKDENGAKINIDHLNTIIDYIKSQDTDTVTDFNSDLCLVNTIKIKIK